MCHNISKTLQEANIPLSLKQGIKSYLAITAMLRFKTRTLQLTSLGLISNKNEGF